MPRVTYRSTSPYALTEQTSFYLSHLVPRGFVQSDTDKTMILKPEHHHRPDKLSSELYGTSTFWWVFMIRNMDKIKDPIYDFKVGLEIHIPPADAF